MSKSNMAQISPFEDERKSDESTPQPGLVKNVCRQWTVHEDEGLAHRLQEDEFRNHFGRNKEHTRTVQTDIRVAKKSHSEELAEMQRNHLNRLQKMKEMENQDQEVAERLQRLLMEEQEELNHRRRHRDQMLALELQEKEQLESVSHTHQSPRLLSSSSNTPIGEKPLPSHRRDLSTSPPDAAASRSFEAPVRPPRKHAAASKDELQKRLQEQQDEEFARMLQEEEQGVIHTDVDYRLAIESQDAEYARILEEKERERCRRAKEKQKAKQEATSSLPRTLPEVAPSSDNLVPAITASRSMSLPLANQSYSETANLSKPGIVCSPSETDSHRYRANQHISPLNNIATLIDPTYGRLHGRDSGTINATSNVNSADACNGNNGYSHRAEAVDNRRRQAPVGKTKQPNPGPGDEIFRGASSKQK